MPANWLKWKRNPAEAGHPLGPSTALPNLQTPQPPAPPGLPGPRTEAGRGPVELPAALVTTAKTRKHQPSITEWARKCTQGPPKNLSEAPRTEGETSG